jgi:meso-butanediol dehydrogenase / (S,S)-butanediol dehydrogenase / diacetyl reductase
VNRSRFQDRRVLVTGAASGIGRAAAERIADEGGAVACLDLDGGGLDSTVASIQDAGRKALACVADVAEPETVERVVAEAAAELGGLDAVANVAGVGDFTGDVTETAPQAWERVLAVNLSGAYHVSRAAIPHLRTAGGGTVVNVGSQFALVGCLASPAYCASKAGLIGLTRAMAVDHAPEGIRVNCVCPGPVDTPMLAGTSATPELTARERARTEHRNLVGRLGRPEEIAATIAFLLSDEAGSMTGSVVAVDGGWTAG